MLPPTRKSHVQPLFSKGILTCFPTMFPSPANKLSPTLSPSQDEGFQMVLGLPPSLPALPHFGVSNKTLGSFSDLNGIIWGGNCGLNPRIMDTGILLLFPPILSSSAFPLGCSFHQVLGDLRTCARKKTRDDMKQEMQRWGFSMPQDSVTRPLHCRCPQKLLGWHTPLMRNLCVNLRFCISLRRCPQWFSISFLHL